MAKQLNVSLAFNADTSKAKAQIQELTKALQDVSKMPASASSLFDDVSIKKASQAALELEQHLSKAVNVDTGKLDLSRFSSSLKASGKNLSDYSQTLLSIGTTGQQAFLSLARAIASADTPVTRVNKKVAELGTTLKNTARWQLSSSVLHGFMGAIQSAYGYAQDLNESLNDIRIVTGQSVDQMKDFAVEANRAAKSLSTTTTEYTKASLIFYQQGLSDSEVQERSDITIKMSQAAGESADQVSSYMTAIWNNFDDGSKSLEYYGDVMANLGAKTAASSAEIAEGLEKFAAIGDTVGLSYEYATAAVTTIVDKTRASASTVGDALKTIFARLQGLKLGETLEDGVDLNKYSAALQAVGIEILDLNGNLKSADNIIQELGDTWGTLSNAQQTALAQTVAGTRQYTQLMALMNNFSAFEQNVDYAKTSEGTLQEQANIYAESWEAAQNRVRASAEDIYDSLINDEFFIDLLNGFEKVLNTIGGLIDGLGGLKGVIGVVGSVFLTAFAQKMPETLSNLRQNIMVFTGQASKEMQKVQAELNKEIAVQQATTGASQEYIAELEGLKQVSAMKQKLVQASRNLTTQERAEYEAKIRNVEMMQEEIIALTKKKKALEEAERAAQKSLSASGSKGVSNLTKDFTAQVDEIERLKANEKRLKEQSDEVKKRSKVNKKTGQVKQAPEDHARIVAIEAERQANNSAIAEAEAKAKALETQITAVGQAYGLTAEQINDMVLANGKLSPEAMEAIKKEAGAAGEQFSKLVRQRTNLENLGTSVKGQAKDWKAAGTAIKDYVAKTGNIKGAKKDVDDMKKHMSAYLKKIQELAKANGLSVSKKQVQELRAAIDGINVNNIEEVADSFASFSENLGKGTDGKIAKLDGQIEQLHDKMTDMQFGDEAISKMEHTAEAAANVGVELDNVRENVKGFATEVPEGVFHASTAMTEFGSAIMSVSTMISSIQGAISVFSDEGATGFEKLGAAISIVTAAMAVFNSVQALSTTLTKSDAAAKLFAVVGYKMIKAESGALTLVKIAETNAVIANTAAWYANPVMWIAAIIIAVIAAIVALVSALGAQEKAQKAVNEETLKYATEVKDAIDGTKELNENVKDLTNSYEELSAAGKDTSEVLAQMDEKIPELISSYRELIKTLGGTDSSALEELVDELERAYNLAKLTGDYSNFSNKQQEVEQEITRIEYDNAINGGRAGAKLAATAMNEATGGTKTNTKMTLDVGGVDSGAGEEIKAQQILSNTMGSYYTNSNGLFKYGAKLTADYSDPAAFVDYYEKLQKAQSEMLFTMSDYQLAQSDIYREISEALSSGAEYYEQMVPLAQAQIESGGKLAEAAVEEEIGLAMEDVNTMEEYLAYKEKYAEQAKKLGLNDDQIEAYLKESEALTDMTNKYEMANQVLEKYIGTSLDKLSDADKKAYLESINQITSELSSEDLQLAVSLIATTDSLEEFESQLAHTSAAAMTRGYEQLSESLKQMMIDSQETNSFKASEIASLKENEDFQNFLASLGKSVEDFSMMNYDDQYAAIAQFYSRVEQLKHDSIQYQKELYYDDMLEYQTVLDKMYNMTEEQEEKSLQLKQEYAEKKAAAEKDGEISHEEKQELENLAEEYKDEFGFEIDLDIVEAKNKLQQIEEAIEDLDQQQIDVAIDWDGIDEIEGAFSQISDFASLMQKDAKKVGNSYQITAAQARKWAQVYPEIFAEAKPTTDGLIELNADMVDNYIAGQDAEIDATIDAKIAQLEAEKATMEAKLEMAEKDLEVAAINAEGKAALEGTSVEYLSALRKSLVQYYMDLGADEVEADAAALQTMGLNQEEYTELVAKASENVSKNQINASKNGANAQANAISQLSARWRNFVNNLCTVAQAVVNALRGQPFSFTWSSFDSGISIDSGSSFESANLDFNFNDYTDTEIDAVRESVNNNLMETLEENKAKIQQAIASIDSQINYLEALKLQDLKDFGSTDPDEVDGTKDKDTGKDKEEEEEEKEKEIKEMLEDIERYHYLTRQVEALERALSRLGEQKERAFGADKLALMDDELEVMNDLYKKSEELLSAQQGMLALDYAKLGNIFHTSVHIDENGDISNYDKLVSEATGALNLARETYNNSAQEDADKDALEEAEDLYEKRIEALEQYEERLDEINDTIDSMEEQLYAIQDKNYEKFNYKMDLELEISESDLEILDYYLNKIADDFKSAEEAAELMIGTMKDLEGGEFGGKMGQYESNLEAAKARQDELNSLFAAGKISEEQYREGLDAVKEQYMENIQAMQELDKEMMEYYGNTLAKAQEELSKYTIQMEHQTAVLEHYKSLIDLMGKSNDYAMISKILEGQVETTENQAEISKTWYESRRADADELKAQYEALADTTTAEAELIKQKWQDAETVANEAQEQMLSDAEAWAEALKAVLENRLSEFGQALENSLTGEWGSFDQMTTAMERANSLQEDYLTTTNQIYETNKLMRTAQQEIDKTTNSVAKKKLAAYIEETQQLQNQTKLSQYELDIQQAKYDLLMAEIALEEAQSSKSTVRLQRDNEGNFGYVYTADSNAISEAQQQLEDAQNKLYNIGLDGANEYAEKYQSTMAEMYDTLGQIQEQYLNGAFESEEEYNTAMENAKAFYYQKLQDYSSLYSVALTTDSRIVADAWSTDFSSMIYDTEKWMTEVDKYVQGTSNAFKAWQSAVTGPNGVTSIVGSSVEEVGGKVQTVTQKSEELADTTRNTVIPALNEEITSVDNLTGAYARMRDTIQDVINKYETLVTGINNDKRSAAYSSNDDNNNGNNSTNGNNNTNVSTSSNSKSTSSSTTYSSTSASTNSSSEKKEIVTWDRVMSAYNRIISGDWGAGLPNRIESGLSEGYTEKEVTLAQDYINYTFSPAQRGQGKSHDEAKKLMGFDTGGYTGDWAGAYGKLAVLHQKELVLNSQDTQNLLASVEILNEILRIIDLQSISSQIGGLLTSPGFGEIGTQTIEQSVTIEANFPGVQDRNEIEAAFDNLINRASQYANRK